MTTAVAEPPAQAAATPPATLPAAPPPPPAPKPPETISETKPSTEPAKSGAEAKTGSEGAAARPAEYALKMPDGAQVKPEVLAAVETFAKERGLTQDQAQALLEREVQAETGRAQAQKEAIEAAGVRWYEEAQADAELGGQDFAKKAELAKRVIERFASESFRKALEDTKLGNHPELLRTFYRIGRRMVEDSLVMPGAPAGGEAKSAEAILYNNNAAKEKA